MQSRTFREVGPGHPQVLARHHQWYRISKNENVEGSGMVVREAPAATSAAEL